MRVSGLLLLVGCSLAGAASIDLVLDDSYTRTEAGLDALLWRRHLQTRSRELLLRGALPDPLLESDRDARYLHDSSLLQWSDTTKDAHIVAHPRLGFARRYELDGPTSSSRKRTDIDSWELDGGGVAVATSPYLAAWVDARIYSEKQSPLPYSYDGQFISAHKEGDDYRTSFTSYARYETRATVESPLGRFGGGRMRQQWGPAYNYPLVLGQWSQPYTQVDWTIDWGNVRLRTLWGSLAVDGAGRFRKDSTTRSVYAHRYEWTPAPWVSLGASEALILSNMEDPVAFLPFVPLFMEKGQAIETRSNGELAFDLSLRPMDGIRLYGEFLIDDASELTSLFNDLWKNRWAATAGVQLARDFAPDLAAGLILETSRVEPWVYTHYVAKTNQATSQDVPLGNPWGPNSLASSATAYAAWRKFSFRTQFEWLLKGTDRGSSVNDTVTNNDTARKAFLAEYKEWFTVAPRATWRGDWMGIWIEPRWTFGDSRPILPRSPAQFLAGLEVNL